LESGEQATSLTPTWLNQIPQTIHVSEVPIPTRNFKIILHGAVAVNINSQFLDGAGCEAQPVVGRQHRQTTHPLGFSGGKNWHFSHSFRHQKT
jgi:hypothetical protein